MATMGLNYYKRYRMEIDLRRREFGRLTLPVGFSLLPWSLDMLELHAEAKFMSFHQEIDAQVFPCFNEYAGCLRLMREISRKPGFMPSATWLLVRQAPATTTLSSNNNTGSQHFSAQYVPPKVQIIGTIQGLIDSQRVGSIQNIGIIPGFRGRGLGSCLLYKALAGFQNANLTRVYLEVTAQNDDAVRLYKRLGFSKVRTVYKVVENTPASMTVTS